MKKLEQLSGLIRSKREETGQNIESLASLLKIRSNLIKQFEECIDPNLSFYHYSHLKRLCQLMHIPFEQYQSEINTEFSLSTRQRQIPKIQLNANKKQSWLRFIILIFFVLTSIWLVLWKHESNTAHKHENSLTTTNLNTELATIKHNPHNILDR